MAVVLNGKAYAKAIFAVKTVCEALQRLLMEKFTEVNAEEHSPEFLSNLVQDCSIEKLNLVIEDDSANAFLQNYLNYEENISKSHTGCVIDHSRLMILQYSVKTKNLSLFHKCNGDMADLFFAFDSPNISRYLV